MNVGALRVDPVVDGSIRSGLRPSKPFPSEDSSLWADQGGMLHGDGLVESTLGAFLVRSADRVVLVDAGCGQAFDSGHHTPTIDLGDPDDPIAASLASYGLDAEHTRGVVDDLQRIRIEQGRLPASLEALGVHPRDVTDVVCTHLHFDHIGWTSSAGKRFFPNATIRCSSADLEYFLDGPDEENYVQAIFSAIPAAQRLAPVLDCIETWDGDEPILPGIDVRLAPGHTPGSSVVVLSSGTARALLLGDVVHCPLELMDNDFNLLVDHDQQLADRVREAYARELEGSDVVAAAAHFPGLRFGRLLRGESTRRWTFDLD